MRPLPGTAFVALAAACVTPPAGAQVRNEAPVIACGTRVAWPASVPRGTGETARLAPASAEAVLAHFLDALTATRYDEALAYARELVLAAPDHEVSHYNLACVLARRGEVDAAIEALEAAVDRGWRSDVHAVLDPDLAHIAPDPRFQSLLHRMRELERAERDVPIPLRRDAVARVRADLEAGVPDLLARHHAPGAAIVVIRSGTPVLELGFGVVSRRAADTSRVAPDTRWAMRAPVDLLALVAGAQLDCAGRLKLDDLVSAAEERAATARLSMRTAAPRTARPVGFLERRASQRRLDPAADAPDGADVREVLMAGVDLAGEGFRTHCRRHVLGTLDLSDTVIGPSPLAMPDLGHGHTAFGTVLAAPDALGSGVVVSSAHDLGRLVAALSRADADILGAGVASRVAHAVFGLDRLGLRVAEREAAAGACIEVFDSAAGITLLLRWYPEIGDGVVVIANVSDGRPLADRLARVAIGG